MGWAFILWSTGQQHLIKTELVLVQVGRILEFRCTEGSVDQLWPLKLALSNGHLKGGMDKPVICPALYSLHSSGDKDIPDVTLTDTDIINHIPLPRSGVHPCSLLFVNQSKHYACDEEYILGTYTQEQKATAVHLANALLAKHSLPSSVVTTNVDIKVT